MAKKIRLPIELISSLFFIFLSLFFLIIMEKEVYVASDGNMINARTFPFIVLVIILTLSLFIFVKETVLFIAKKKVKYVEIDVKEELKAMIIFLILLFYAISIKFFGFFISSIIFPSFLSFFLGERKKKNLALVAISSLLICLLFRYVLNVRLV